MTRGRQGGETGWTAGAWLATTLDDGTVRRERLLTFNPFARPGASATREVKGPTRRAAWHREASRFRRAGQNTCSVGMTTRRGGARPPRLTAAQVRALHELARLRAAGRQGAAAVARNHAGGH